MNLLERRLRRGPHASSRPALMHSVHSKIRKQMRLEVKSTDISCSECLVDLSVFSNIWSFFVLFIQQSFSQIDKPKGSSMVSFKKDVPQRPAWRQSEIWRKTHFKIWKQTNMLAHIFGRNRKNRRGAPSLFLQVAKQMLKGKDHSGKSCVINLS